jgi:7-carboxy-7-deazaguanine synthase
MSATVPSILQSRTAMPLIAEVFGPTFQGEGPSIGTRAAFVRFAKCNLTCGWCDTPYTWDWDRYEPKDEIHPMPVEDIAGRVREMDVPLVVMTGGEPLLQQQAMMDLMDRLTGHRFEIETNGTIVPQGGLLGRAPRFNVSPKLRNSEVLEKKRWKARPLSILLDALSTFKFVCEKPEDLNEVQEYVDKVGIPAWRVWVMPEGVTPEMVTRHGRDLSEAVLERGWNMTTRMQVLLWGAERGH